jgi:hypothetical protein
MIYCQLADCAHNQRAQCTTDIEVVQSASGPVCATYEPLGMSAGSKMTAIADVNQQQQPPSQAPQQPPQGGGGGRRY